MLRPALLMPCFFSMTLTRSGVDGVALRYAPGEPGTVWCGPTSLLRDQRIGWDVSPETHEAHTIFSALARATEAALQDGSLRLDWVDPQGMVTRWDWQERLGAGWTPGG